METPAYKFRPEDYDVVYEPAEDSFLLLDALEEELPSIRALRPLVSVEIGPGSGIIITALAKALRSGLFLGVDINPHACTMTKRTSALNGCHWVDAVNGNLLGTLRSGQVDLLLFNPPYVPTSEDDDGSQLEEQIDEFREEGRDLVKSWAGGRSGMVVTNRVLSDLDRILSPEGIFYLLLLKENEPAEVVERLAKIGFFSRVIKERKIRGEHLFVLKISRNKS